MQYCHFNNRVVMSDKRGYGDASSCFVVVPRDGFLQLKEVVVFPANSVHGTPGDERRRRVLAAYLPHETNEVV